MTSREAVGQDSESRGRRTVQQLFDPRDNSLNTLRLIFAAMVIFAHCYDLSGLPQPKIGDLGFGRFGVWAFFGLSGFLIARSRESHSLLRYGWARFLRIYPAFWVCLIVTAFFFAAFVGAVRGGWHMNDALSYVSSNASLYIRQDTIGTTLAWSPENIWNGPLWTLFFEFCCYVMIGVFFSVHKFRSGLATVILFTLVSGGSILSQLGMVNLSGNGLGLIRIFLELAPFFLAGAVMHAARHVIIVSPWLFLASLGAILLAGWLGWAKPLAPLPLAYGAIWLGIKMPRVIERVRGGTIDISYGTYIYGYPVQQLLVLAGLPQFGVPAMFVGSIAATAVPASLSWFFIEKPCLRLKNTRWPFRFP